MIFTQFVETHAFKQNCARVVCVQKTERCSKAKWPVVKHAIKRLLFKIIKKDWARFSTHSTIKMLSTASLARVLAPPGSIPIPVNCFFLSSETLRTIYVRMRGCIKRMRKEKVI